MVGTSADGFMIRLAVFRKRELGKNSKPAKFLIGGDGRCNELNM